MKPISLLCHENSKIIKLSKGLVKLDLRLFKRFKEKTGFFLLYLYSYEKGYFSDEKIIVFTKERNYKV